MQQEIGRPGGAATGAGQRPPSYAGTRLRYACLPGVDVVEQRAAYGRGCEQGQDSQTARGRFGQGESLLRGDSRPRQGKYSIAPPKFLFSPGFLDLRSTWPYTE